jgi:hypothetical protein
MSGPSARPSAQARFDHGLFEYTRGLRAGKAVNQRSGVGGAGMHNPNQRRAPCSAPSQLPPSSP